jgi:hypothetical protein
MRSMGVDAPLADVQRALADELLLQLATGGAPPDTNNINERLDGPAAK